MKKERLKELAGIGNPLVINESIFKHNTKLLPADFDRFKESYLDLGNDYQVGHDKDGTWWGFRKGEKNADWKYMEQGQFGHFKLLSDLKDNDVFRLAYKRRGWEDLFESHYSSNLKLNERRRRKGVLNNVYWDALELGFEAVEGFNKKLGPFVNVISNNKRQLKKGVEKLARKYDLEFEIQKDPRIIGFRATFYSPELTK